MPEFNLDQLKKTWQEQKVTPKYGDSEILEMLNRKSRNYVKYILWISIVEFVSVLAISGYLYFSGDEGKSFVHILEKLNVKVDVQVLHNLNLFYLGSKILSIGIALYFVIKFYENYKKINVESNLKKLIIQIIKFKKTVNLFIKVNIVFMVLMTLFLVLFMIFLINQQSVVLDQATVAGFLIGFAISLGACIALIFLYYRVIYGIIMGRLGKNLKQLKEIDQQNTME